MIDQNGVPVRELRISGSRKSVDLATSLIRKCWAVPKDSASASAADFEPGECSEGRRDSQAILAIAYSPLGGSFELSYGAAAVSASQMGEVLSVLVAVWRSNPASFLG